MSNLASAEHSGCICQHQWQNSVAVQGDAAFCWLVISRWRFV